MLLQQSWTRGSWQPHIKQIWRNSIHGWETAALASEHTYLRLSSCEHRNWMHCWTRLFSRMWTEYLLSKLSFKNWCKTHRVLGIRQSQCFAPNDLFLPQYLPAAHLAWTCVNLHSLTRSSIHSPNPKPFCLSLAHVQHRRSVSRWPFLLLFNMAFVKGWLRELKGWHRLRIGKRNIHTSGVLSYWTLCARLSAPWGCSRMINAMPWASLEEWLRHYIL